MPNFNCYRDSRKIIIRHLTKIVNILAPVKFEPATLSLSLTDNTYHSHGVKGLAFISVSFIKTIKIQCKLKVIFYSMLLYTYSADTI